MPRGGKRQGTPGAGYSNRTDLLMMRKPDTGVPTAGTGGQTAPAQAPQQSFVSPEMIPRLDDPTGRPGDPLTHGLDVGPGPGSEVRPSIAPIDPSLATLQAAYLRNPTPELRAVLMRLSAQGLL